MCVVNFPKRTAAATAVPVPGRLLFVRISAVFFIISTTCVLLNTVNVTDSRIFTRCELAIELYVKHNISWKLIPDWICIADVATGLNSSYIQVSPPGSNHTNYGIFRIHHRFWCHDGFEEKNMCDVNCRDLVGDNITKSIQCAQIIYTLDNQFDAWSDWRLKCKDKDVKRYLRDCKVIPGQVPPEMMMPPERRNRTMTADKENQYLTCEASGNPPPDLYWRYNKTQFPELFTRAEEKGPKMAPPPPPRGGSRGPGHAGGDAPPLPGGAPPISVLKLFFPKMDRKYAGEYSCFAENIAGETEAVFNLRVKDKWRPDKDKDKDDGSWDDDDDFFETSHPTLFYSLAVGIPILVGLLAAATTVYVYRRCCSGGASSDGGGRFGFGKGTFTATGGKGLYGGSTAGESTAALTAAEIREFEDGVPELQHKLIDELYVCRENIIYQPYNRLYELDEDVIAIDRFSILGSGQFGVVLRGKEVKTGKPVAVKTVQTHCTNKLYVKALLSELKILIYLGTHPHIVNLVGARTAQLDQGVVFLFVEFCALGDLENFLRKRKESFVDCERCGHYARAGSAGPDAEEEGSSSSPQPPSTYQVNIYDHDPISTCDLYRWSGQISTGMEYLAGKKVIHGDLATRNILLVNKSCAKITDFGLAKQLYDYTNYVKSHETPLPWRSLAIESLREMSFSTQSDVWSFGVTLWEIFSLGDIPYTAGTQFSIDFIGRLQEGLRLSKPDYASDALYEEMLRCWNLRPNERPSFTLLKNVLIQMGEECLLRESETELLSKEVVGAEGEERSEETSAQID